MLLIQKENVQYIISDNDKEKYLKDGFKVLKTLDDKSKDKSDKKPLSKKNSMELTEQAKELGIEGYESLTNKELIAVIKEAQSNGN